MKKVLLAFLATAMTSVSAHAILVDDIADADDMRIRFELEVEDSLVYKLSNDYLQVQDANPAFNLDQLIHIGKIAKLPTPAQALAGDCSVLTYDQTLSDSANGVLAEISLAGGTDPDTGLGVAQASATCSLTDSPIMVHYQIPLFEHVVIGGGATVDVTYEMIHDALDADDKSFSAASLEAGATLLTDLDVASPATTRASNDNTAMTVKLSADLVTPGVSGKMYSADLLVTVVETPSTP